MSVRSEITRILISSVIFALYLFFIYPYIKLDLYGTIIVVLGISTITFGLSKFLVTGGLNYLFLAAAAVAIATIAVFLVG